MSVPAFIAHLIRHLSYADLGTAISDHCFARLARTLAAVILDGNARTASNIPEHKAWQTEARRLVRGLEGQGIVRTAVKNDQPFTSDQSVYSSVVISFSRVVDYHSMVD